MPQCGITGSGPLESRGLTAPADLGDSAKIQAFAKTVIRSIRGVRFAPLPSRVYD